MEDSKNQKLYDFIEEVKGTKSKEETWNVLLRLFNDQGFEHASLNFDIEDGKEVQVVHTAPEWVLDSWIENVGCANDLAIQHCLSNASPYFSGDKLFPQTPSDEFMEWWNSLQDIDVRTSADFPVRFNDGCSGTIGLYTELESAEFTRLFAESGSLLHFASVIAAERYHAQWRSDHVPHLLTEKETECLRLLGTGLQRGQIADYLSIKPVTVDYHFQNIKRKMSAKTREQALAIAALNGMIQF